MLSLCILVSSKRPQYNIIMVSSKKEMVSGKNTIRIPGYQGEELICTESDKIRQPTFSGDPKELLSKFEGKCFITNYDGEQFEFCYGGESKLNGVSLGFYSDYEIINRKLTAVTSKGYQCDNTTYILTAYFSCDYSAPKSQPLIPTFWHDRTDKCHIFTEVYNRQLCKHQKFGYAPVIDVTCMPKNIFEK